MGLFAEANSAVVVLVCLFVAIAVGVGVRLWFSRQRPPLEVDIEVAPEQREKIQQRLAEASHVPELKALTKSA